MTAPHEADPASLWGSESVIVLIDETPNIIKREELVLGMIVLVGDLPYRLTLSDTEINDPCKIPHMRPFLSHGSWCSRSGNGDVYPHAGGTYPYGRSKPLVGYPSWRRHVSGAKLLSLVPLPRAIVVADTDPEGGLAVDAERERSELQSFPGAA